MKKKLLIVALSLFLVDSLKAQYTMLRETWRSETTEINATEVWSVDMKTNGGNIYQLGKLHNGSNTDVVVAKISNAGAVLWQQVYNGGTEDTPVSIGVDNSGNSYAIMTSVVSGTNRMRVVKYNTSGVQQWIWSQTGGVLGSIANNGTTDATGNTYVIGNDGAGASMKTYKISNAGVQTWTISYSPNAFARNGSMVAVDASSNVYVCGWQNTTANGIDWVTLKYNSAGVQQWVQSYGGSGNDTAKTIIIDGASNVIVGGKYNTNEAHVRKYTAAGATSWTNTVDLNIDNNSSVVLQFDNSNNIYAAVCRQIYSSNKKQTHLKKISSAGAGLWDQYYSGTTVPLSQPNQWFENYPKQILVHNDSNYVYVGIDGTSKNNSGFVSRGFHIARFRTTDGSYNVTYDNVSHNYSYPDLAYTNTIAFADNNQSIIITGSHKYAMPYKIRTVKFSNYTPVVKAHAPSFAWSTNSSVLYMCDLGARNASDSIRLDPSGLQPGYSYWWVAATGTNEDAYTQYFTNRSDPNSYYNPPVGHFSMSYKLKITDSNNEIFYSLPVSITRHAFDNSVTTSGSTQLCIGQTVDLSMPQVGKYYGFAIMYKIVPPNQNMQNYTGNLASSNDSLLYTASTSGNYYFDVERQAPSSLGALTYSGYVGTSGNNTCYYPSDTISVVIGNPTITSTTPNSICGSGIVTLGATASVGTLSWYAASTGGSVLGTGTIFVTPSIGSTTTYYVESSNGGCTSPRTAVIATINISPTATINQTGNMLIVQESGLLYQWVDCNTGNSPISGENGQSFNVAVNGNYAVEVTENGCTTTSNCVNVTVTGIESLNSKSSLNIYPNPSRGIFNVESNESIRSIQIFDALGKIVFNQNEYHDTKIQVNLLGLNKGIYFIKVATSNSITTNKIIIE